MNKEKATKKEAIVSKKIVGNMFPVVGIPELVLGLLVRMVGTRVGIFVGVEVIIIVGVGVMIVLVVIVGVGVVVVAEGEAE